MISPNGGRSTNCPTTSVCAPRLTRIGLGRGLLGQNNKDQGKRPHAKSVKGGKVTLTSESNRVHICNLNWLIMVATERFSHLRRAGVLVASASFDRAASSR